MLSTHTGAADDVGNAARVYTEGGVYDAPGSMPVHVARIFLQAGLAELVDPGPPETKPAGPPEVKGDPVELKPPEQEIDGAKTRRRTPRHPRTVRR